MSLKIWIVALATLSLTVTAVDAKKHRKHLPPPAPAGAIWPFDSRYDEPAHFIRLPNGLVVSSYECFTDEGYGRYRPCGAGSKF